MTGIRSNEPIGLVLGGVYAEGTLRRQDRPGFDFGSPVCGNLEKMAAKGVQAVAGYPALLESIKE